MKVPAVNERIEHTTFGRGTVQRVRKDQFGGSVMIDFDVHGKKELCWYFAHTKCKILEKEIHK